MTPHSLPWIMLLALIGVSSSASQVCFSRSPVIDPEQRTPTTRLANSITTRLWIKKPVPASGHASLSRTRSRCAAASTRSPTPLPGGRE